MKALFFGDEDVDLLADVEGSVFGFGEAIDDLEDAGVDAFGAGAGEGGFGDDEGFDAFELERVRSGGVAFEEGGGGLAGADAHGVLFVDIDADLEGIDITEDEGGRLVLAGGVFAGANVDLEYGGVFGGADGEAFDEELGLFDIGLSGFELSAGGEDFGFGDGEVVGAIGDVILADGALIGDGLEAVEGGAGFVELGERDVEIGLADSDGGVLFAEGSAEFAVVDDEEDIVFFDFVPDVDFDFADDAGSGDADGDVFTEGLDDAGGGDAT